MKCLSGFQIGYDYGMCLEMDNCEIRAYCRKYASECIGKADFGSKIIADHAALRLNDSNYNGYQCSYCGGWHIGRSWD